MSSSKDLSPSEKMRAALPDEPSPRRTPSIFIFLTGLLTTLLVAACCFSGIALWWFRPMTSENPEYARKLTHEIVAIQIPDSFVPRGTIDWNIGFVMRLRGVYYERLVGDGVLTLLEVNTQLANDDSVRRHIRETLLKESSSGTTLRVDPARNQKETLKINGEPVLFNLDIARDPRTNESFHLVEGVFPGNSGQVLFALRIDSSRWLDEPLALDSLAAEESHSKFPAWLLNMLRSIGQDASSPQPATSPPGLSSPSSPSSPGDRPLVPVSDPIPAPGPIQ